MEKPIRELYRDPTDQHTTHFSLQTDTAVYFLSVNTSQTGFRYTPVTNNVAGNSLPAETYYMHTGGNYYFNAYTGDAATGLPNLGLQRR
jgi:hypothetical protein